MERYVAVTEGRADHYVRDTETNAECACTRYTLRGTAEGEAEKFNRAYRAWMFATELYRRRLASQ